MKCIPKTKYVFCCFNYIVANALWLSALCISRRGPGVGKNFQNFMLHFRSLHKIALDF